MFDIGGWEFLVIAILAIVIIGPKDLPAAVRAVTVWARKARALAADFRSGLDDIAREVELDKVEADIREGLGGGDLTDSMNTIREDIEHNIDPDGEITGAFNPDRDVEDDFDDDLDDEDEDDEITRIASDEAEETVETASDDEDPAVADTGGKAGA